jgi:hypothetical protein
VLSFFIALIQSLFSRHLGSRSTLTHLFLICLLLPISPRNSKENREKVKTENPGITFGGTGKKLGEMWRALSDKAKEEYKSKKG